jgi:hypothetical protein
MIMSVGRTRKDASCYLGMKVNVGGRKKMRKREGRRKEVENSSHSINAVSVILNCLCITVAVCEYMKRGSYIYS